MLDIELLSKNLEESFQKIDAATGKDVVLFIGQTGAGKSTLINYQLGFGMKMFRGKAVPMVAEVPAEMSGGAKSVTFYPSTYPSSHDIVYCDCPGFEDNRGDEARVSVSLATEALVHRARRIDAVVVVIDWRALDVGRGKPMEGLALILGFLFKREVDFSGSVLFAFSHVPADQGIDVEYIAEVTQEVLTEQANGLKKLERDRTRLEGQQSPIDEVLDKIEAQNRILYILGLILNNQRAIFIADVFDNGATRQFLIEKIYAMRKKAFLTKDAFDFASSDPVRKTFRDQVREELSKSADSMESYLAIPGAIEVLENDIAEKERRITDYKENIKDIEGGRKFLGENDPIVVENRKKVSQMQHSNQSKKEERSESKKKMDDLKRSKYQLDTDDEILFETLDEQSSSSIRKGYTMKKAGSQLGSAATSLTEGDVFDAMAGSLVFMTGALIAAPVMASKAALTAERILFTYEGAPFTRAVARTQHGRNKILVSEPGNGVYKSRFTADRMSKFSAVVEIYGAKRNLPDNKIKIQRLSTQIEAEENKIKKLSSEMVEIGTTILLIEKTIADFLSVDKQGAEEQKKNFYNLIANEEQSIIKVREEIKEQIEKQAVMLGTFQGKRGFYEKILEISAFLNLNTTGTPEVVENFVVVYSKVFVTNVKLPESAYMLAEDTTAYNEDKGRMSSSAPEKILSTGMDSPSATSTRKGGAASYTSFLGGKTPDSSSPASGSYSSSSYSPYHTSAGPYATSAGPYATSAGPYATSAGPYATSTGPYATSAGPYASGRGGPFLQEDKASGSPSSRSPFSFYSPHSSSAGPYSGGEGGPFLKEDKASGSPSSRSSSSSYSPSPSSKGWSGK